MDGTTALAVIPVTVGVCTLLHLMLEKRIKERIEFLNVQLSETRRELEEAKKQTPEILAQTLHNTVTILKSELTELNKEKEGHAETIKKKEQELADAFARIAELNEQMNTAQGMLEEYEYFKEEFSCPYCSMPLATRSDGYTSYECGYSPEGHPCPHDPEFPTLDEYELELKHNRNQWYCFAKPKTKNASKLTLDSTWGHTPEKAKERMVERYKHYSRNVSKKK
jgi:rubrerythrin